MVIMVKQPSAKAQVAAYLAALPPDARKALKQVRAAIRVAAPKAEEGFSYRIPSFRLGDRPLVWYAAFKNHYSIYPIGASITRALAKDVDRYETAKGTIRFPLDEPVPVGLVKKLVKARIAEAKQRGK
jgi:uncharacterized protein YdhG (YjbR/CyaY superfamily)